MLVFVRIAAENYSLSVFDTIRLLLDKNARSISLFIFIGYNYVIPEQNLS